MADVERELLEHEQILANTGKLDAERLKLIEEAAKLRAETLKLRTERHKLERDRFWQPVLALAAFIGAFATAVKLFWSTTPPP